MSVNRHQPRRRAAAGVFIVIMLFVICGMAALSVDVGALYVARTELQRTADAAALAAAWELLDQDKLTGSPNMDAEIYAARVRAQEYALANAVQAAAPALDINVNNAASGDIVLGYISDPLDPDADFDFVNPDQYNAVRIRVRRDASLNGPIDNLFAQMIGFSSSSVSATATAVFKDNVGGYRIPGGSNRKAKLLPFALHIDAWNGLVNGTDTNGDGYAYNVTTGAVSTGNDGIPELNLYPGGGTGQLTPGNFGTVDIGPSNNSTADIARQILEGVNAADLAVFGGELKLGDDGTMILEGDTGLSAGVKDELESIIGKPRAIPLFSAVEGPGNNAEYTIVGFAGIRIMHVQLTGKMSKKHLMIQPAFVVDETSITQSGVSLSAFVYEPVRLIR